MALVTPWYAPCRRNRSSFRQARRANGGGQASDEEHTVRVETAAHAPSATLCVWVADELLLAAIRGQTFSRVSVEVLVHSQLLTDLQMPITYS
jgi:hypothetical protein